MLLFIKCWQHWPCRNRNARIKCMKFPACCLRYFVNGDNLLALCSRVLLTPPLCFQLTIYGPTLWSSGQSFWLQIQRSRVRFPALPDFLSSSRSGTGSTQPREVNWGATWIKKVATPVQKTEINGRGDPLRWSRDTPLSAKVGTNIADRRRPLCRYSSLTD